MMISNAGSMTPEQIAAIQNEAFGGGPMPTASLSSAIAKNEDTFIGLHRVLSQTGTFIFNITFHLFEVICPNHL